MLHVSEGYAQLNEISLFSCFEHKTTFQNYQKSELLTHNFQLNFTLDFINAIRNFARISTIIQICNSN